MQSFPSSLVSDSDRLATVGLIVLQADETIEQDFRRLFRAEACDFFVSRVPSGLEVTPETLAAMADEMTAAASLFPRSAQFDVVGYGCTSGTSVIGAERVATLVKQGCTAKAVTEPVSALVHACHVRNITRLAFLSPYIATVSDRLREVLAGHGIETPEFGSFNEAEEAKVARIDAGSIIEAAGALAKSSAVDGVFLSCTNLNALGVLDEIAQRTGKPAMSSNSVLAEHMRELAGIKG